jgi:16S rRNA G527 N7-methylase RsmG
MTLPATVEVARVEEVATSSAVGLFDLVTFRAVRADQGLWRAVDRLLAPSGRVLWFGGIGHSIESGMIAVGAVGTTIALQRST